MGRGTHGACDGQIECEVRESYSSNIPRPKRLALLEIWVIFISNLFFLNDFVLAGLKVSCEGGRLRE